MDDAELRAWLGVDESVPIRQSIIEGMREVPRPVDDASEVAAFKMFLGCAGEPARPK